MRKYFFAGVLLLAVLPAAAAEDAVPEGMSSNGSGQQSVRYTQTYDEYGEVASSSSDTNGDGIIDEKITYKKGVAEKVERDTDGDGKMDEVQEPEKDKGELK